LQLPDALESEEIPEAADPMSQTYVAPRNKFWIWTAVNQVAAGIFWRGVIGDRSGATFKHLRSIVHCWYCFFYVTDGWKVHRCLLMDEDHIVSGLI